MINIGCVSIDVSHPLGIANLLRDNCMDMRYTYVWDKNFRKPEEKEWFVKHFGLVAEVDEIKDMVDKVDVGFVHSCNWEKHLDLAMPFIEAGKPVFLDKPVVGSVADVKKVRQLIAGGAKIIGGSSVRYAEEIQNFLSQPVEKRGEVIAAFCTSGNNEFDYAIHAVEALSELAGAKAKSIKFVGNSKNAENQTCEVYTIEYENGVIGTYYSVLGRYNPFNITVITTTQTVSFQILTSRIMRALAVKIGHELKEGSAMADMETLLNCTEIMLCGKKSRDELNGAPVTIDMLEEGDKFDGYAFEEGYAARAGISYKD